MRSTVFVFTLALLAFVPIGAFANGTQEHQQQQQQEQQQNQNNSQRFPHPILNQIVNDFNGVLFGASADQQSWTGQNGRGAGLIGAINHGFVPVIFKTLFFLEIVWIAAQMILGKLNDPSDVIFKFFALFFCYYLVNNFVIISTVFKNGFLYIVNTYLLPGPPGGTKESTAFNLSAASMLNDPTTIMTWASDNIVRKMHQGAWNLFQAVLSNTVTGRGPGIGSGAMLAMGGEYVMFGIEKLLIGLAFAVLAVELTIAQIEFYIVLLFALIFVPFITFEPLRFVGTRSFMAVIGQTIKLGMTLAVITIGMHVIEGLGSQLVPANIDLTTEIGVFAATLVLIFLAIQVPTLALSFITGNPGLSSGGFFGNMAGIGGAVVAVGATLFSAGASLLGGRGAISDAGRQSGGSSSQPAYAVAPATSTVSVTAVPTYGAAGAGAQEVFRPAPSGVPPAGRASGPSPQASVNPTSTPPEPGSAGGASADKYFQPPTVAPAAVSPSAARPDSTEDVWIEATSGAILPKGRS